MISEENGIFYGVLLFLWIEYLWELYLSLRQVCSIIYTIQMNYINICDSYIIIIFIFIFYIFSIKSIKLKLICQMNLSVF